MTKTLSERIAERIGPRESSSYQRNRAAFLALRSEIRTALEDGWSMRLIWNTLHSEKRVAFGYETFTIYVKKLIKQPTTTVPTTRSEPKVPARPVDFVPLTEPAQRPEQLPFGHPDREPTVGKAELPKFKHNPIPKERS